MIIKLTHEELKFLWDLSATRLQVNEQNKIKNQKRDPNKSDIEIGFIGACGEFAFCRAFGLDYDISTHSRSGGMDCQMNGYRFDVKASKNRGDYVFVKFRDYPYIDMFSFCHVQRDVMQCLKYGSGITVVILGYQRKEFIVNNRNIINGYDGPCYSIKTKNLHKFKTYLNP